MNSSTWECDGLIAGQPYAIHTTTTATNSGSGLLKSARCTIGNVQGLLASTSPIT